MKYLIVIGDGMADNPVPSLGGKTPLEATCTPVMDSLAANGELGSARTVPVGVEPGSDTAILSIFGYDPRQFYSGRSPLEAAGSGVALKDGDVSYRCNMVALSDEEESYEDKRILSHNGGSVDGEAALELMRAVLADPEFAALAEATKTQFYLNPSFRHIAVQEGADIEGLVAIPPHEHLDETVGANLPTGSPAAEGLRKMMAAAHRVLDRHPVNEARRAAGKLPANALWFWAEGRAIALPGFETRHHKKGIVISAVPLVRGIGTLAGLHFRQVPGATGELDTDYEGKADAALECLAKGYDFVVVHVEAPDECTHNGDTKGKLQAIEWLDKRTIGRLADGLQKAGEPWRMLVLSDHKTLTATRGHDADPVPYILYDSRAGLEKPADEKTGYTEQNAQAGPMVEEGYTLVDRLFED